MSNDDDTYDGLLDSCEALRNRLATVTAERDALRKSLRTALQHMRHNHADWTIADTNDRIDEIIALTAKPKEPS